MKKNVKKRREGVGQSIMLKRSEILWRPLGYFVLCWALIVGVIHSKEITLLNVSYDPTREFYTEYNSAFAKYWKAKRGDEVTVYQSHGGSGKQARSVMEGLPADIVTLALASDIQILSQRGGLLPIQWQKLLPQNSAPYTSTIVFLVRKGNPKKIEEWSDLIRQGIGVISANPKTSGGARWGFLAAYRDALERNHGEEVKAKAYLRALVKNIPVFDAGSRSATTTFIERGIGDVLICWENEAILVSNQIGKDRFEIIRPSTSLLAEPPVAVVEQVVKRRGTAEVASAYLEYLYSEEGQKIIAKHHFRPRDPKVLSQCLDQFPKMKLYTIEESFGGWEKAHAQFFSQDGIFDQVSIGE